jgi:hypothetical protein
LVDAAVPEVIYYVAASVDGYIATMDGGIEWLAPFEGTGEDYGYAQFYDSVEAVLLGRRTYEKRAWPSPSGRTRASPAGCSLTAISEAFRAMCPHRAGSGGEVMTTSRHLA